MFCNTLAFCDDSNSPNNNDIDWTGMSSDTIVAMTLRRDYLLVLLQELVDSSTQMEAETALKKLNGAVSEEEVVYLKFLDRAGALTVIQDVLDRPIHNNSNNNNHETSNGEEQQQEEETPSSSTSSRPSPLVAAPLLYKFAKHNIGFKRTENGQIVACERKQKGYWHLLKKVAGYP